MTRGELLLEAEKVLSSQQLAEAWVERPALALEWRTPAEVLEAPDGPEQLRQLLSRIEFGVYT
ncbi:DUF2384 domain-containing protein [Ruegeria sediminis]|uniref:DUF2384 domain-containing protein n=1 Tax=Ruegeria sediminis TaxID=2583820 RepID=A0ABY2WSU9_9RHOB|nr:antitoxin Xre/MbcA/ParS toxin-binding domain-containing protein [Ruegeria sediminis]TMV02587.1 DUF2384 domain-containing protein [Ruegeria sediminis]